jgi:hypothetical protein
VVVMSANPRSGKRGRDNTRPGGELARDAKRTDAGPQFGGEAWPTEEAGTKGADAERFGHERINDTDLRVQGAGVGLLSTAPMRDVKPGTEGAVHHPSRKAAEPKPRGR